MRVGPVQTRAVVAATQNGLRWRRGVVDGKAMTTRWVDFTCSGEAKMRLLAYYVPK